MKPYYEDSSVTIFNMDSREFLANAPSCFTIDAVITDPPYGVGLEYASTDDTADHILPIILWTLEQCRRVAKRVALTPGVKNLFHYPKPDHTGSFFYPSGAGCNSWGFSCWQPILFYGKDPYSGIGSRPDSRSSCEGAEKNGHPCPKPIGQWSWLVERASLLGESILDAFMGSGTTLRAAKDLGRKAVGIEIEERYCEIAARRMQQEVFQFTETPTQTTTQTELI